MDNPSCASCRKGLSLEEIERGGFQHIGGRLYCAECVAKMRRKGPTRCPVCQTVDTPLYTGTTYVCRKCGADLTQKPATAPAKTRAAATESAESPRKKPTKQCPYCGGVLAAQALRCRYCGSALTREAHDLGATARQNLRLRFWLGCLLGASVLLLVFLVYALTRKAEPSQARDREQAAAAYAELEAQIDDLKGERRFGQAIAACRSFAARHPDSPEAKRARKLEDALRTELRAAREHLAASFHKALGKGDLDAAEQSVAELARSHATDVDDGLHALIAMDLALSRARANSVERGLEAKLAELPGKTPEPKAAVKGSATKTDNQDDERRAKAAAAAYEQLTAKLGGLKEARRYGEAIEQ